MSFRSSGVSGWYADGSVTSERWVGNAKVPRWKGWGLVNLPTAVGVKLKRPIPDAYLKSGRPQGNEKYQLESSGTDRVLGLQASFLFTN